MTKLHHSLFALFVVACMSTAASSSSLSPGDFVAAGEFTGTTGSYTINSDTLAFTGPSGFSFDGLADNDIAVFSFTNFTLGPSASITTTGSRPVAILSQTDIVMLGNSSIQARAGGGAGGGIGQNGQGPGGGFTSREEFFGGPGGGGGFGGPGGDADMGGLSLGGRGGASYGDLSVQLQGGSGGAGGRDNNGNADPGGDGGGGIQLAALNSIELLGSGIFADGVDGGSATTTGGGGGSGGGIHIHAPSVTLGSVLSAKGGAGSEATFDYGGGGGGGRILVEYSPQGGFTLENGSMSVDGGAGIDEFFGTSQPGRDGSLRVIASIPEPDSYVLLLAGVALLAGIRRRSWKLLALKTLV